jgi:AbrB family looped-hinge helix DNA binding protein
METSATTKGQVVIPAPARRKLGIREGTRIHVELDEAGRRIILTPITREYIHGLRGRYRGKGLMDALRAEKRLERDL